MKQVAGCLVKRNGKYLLVQEKIPVAYGLWNLPAGHVDKGESLQEAAARECFEETGLRVTVQDEIYVTNDGHAEIHIFAAKAESNALSWSREELLDAGWFSSDEISKLPLREQSFTQLFS